MYVNEAPGVGTLLALLSATRLREHEATRRAKRTLA